MTLPASISIRTKFDQQSSPYKFKLTNLTDFTAEGITLTNVRGNFKIVNPQGTIVWDNTSLVTPDLYSFSITSITRSSTTATATTATNHNLETGDYVMIAGAAQGAYNGLVLITKINSTSFSYTVAGAPATPATGTILGLKMSLNSKAIPLDGATGMPILGDYIVTLTTIIIGGVQDGTYEKSFTYTYNYQRPTISITQSLNCKLPSFTSTDATTYMQNGVQPTYSRTHLIDFPADSGIPQETFVLQTVPIYAPKVWNGIYVTSIITLLEYTFDDDLVVSDTTTGSRAFPASCDINLCAINCCLNQLNQDYLNLVGVNKFKANELLDKLDRALQLKDLWEANVNCGNDSEAQKNLTELYKVTGCSDDCGCSENTGQIIPYSGFIGKTILEWSAEVGNSQFDYINYNNYLYKALQNTTAGQNPTDDPSLFQVIGYASFNLNPLKSYVADEYLWFEKQLFKTIDDVAIGETPLTNRDKFQYVAGGVNTANVSGTLTYNKNSGVLVLAGLSILPGTVGSLAILNSTFFAGCEVELDLYRQADGYGVIVYKKTNDGSCDLSILNSHPSESLIELDIYFNNKL